VTDQFETPTAERDIAVHSAAMLPRLSDGVEVPETIREVTRLMFLNRTALVAYDLLQGYDVGVNLGEYLSDAFNANQAIESPALVNVVGGDAEAIHGYLHLVLDQRGQHLLGFLPAASLLPLGRLHAFALREIGGENRPELIYERRIVKTDIGFFA
jgi:hypothetical protein